MGPLLLAAGFAMGLGWRWAYAGLALLCLLLVIVQGPKRFPAHAMSEESAERQLSGILSGLWEAIRNWNLLRWIILLEFSDLLLDVLTGYLPLYFTDVSGFSTAQTSLLLSILMGAGLLSNLALIPVLERVPGRRGVRWSSATTLVIYPLFLLVPWPWVKVGLAILLKLVTLGWYSTLSPAGAASRSGGCRRYDTLDRIDGRG